MVEICTPNSRMFIIIIIIIITILVVFGGEMSSHDWQQNFKFN